jgi:predicted MFS family arabinose efflux permease
LVTSPSTGTEEGLALAAKLAWMQRRVVSLLYVSLLIGEMSWAAVAPLLPSIGQRFSLGDLQIGLILGLGSLGILVISIPAGALVKRIGAKRLTVVAAAAMAVGDVTIGLAPKYGFLLIGRCVFGLGFGMLWVGSASWLHDAAGEHRARTLSMTSVVIGVGSLLGPGFGGVIGEHLGLGAPFISLAAAAVAIEIALLLEARDQPEVEREDEPRLIEMLRAAGSDEMIRASIIMMLVATLLWFTVYLLVPLRLDSDGWSASRIGVMFSISSLIYAAVSWFVAHRAARWSTLGVAALATGALSATFAVVVVSDSVVATVTFLMLAGITSAVMITLTFPLGLASSRRVPVALLGGILNVAWASAGLFGATFGGLAAQGLGDRATFLLLALITAGSAVFMLRGRRRLQHQPLPLA